MTSRENLKRYFKTGSRPTEGQFAELIDSMAHKDDSIEPTRIDGLTDMLNVQASKAAELEAATAQTEARLREVESVAEDHATSLQEHEGKLEETGQMMEEQWEEMWRLGNQIATLRENLLDHPEAEDLGRTETLEELDTMVRDAIAGYAYYGHYENYVWNDLYGVRSRQYEVDEDGNYIPTGYRRIERLTGLAGSATGQRADYVIVYTLYDLNDSMGNPEPASRLSRPMYEVRAYRLYDGRLMEGTIADPLRLQYIAGGEETAPEWDWVDATPLHAIAERVEALETTVRTLSELQDTGEDPEGLLDLAQQVRSLKAETDALGESLRTLQGDTDSALGTATTAREALAERLAEVEATAGNLQTALQTETTQRTTGDATLQSQIDAHTTTLGTQAMRLQTAEGQIERLQTAVEGLQDEAEGSEDPAGGEIQPSGDTTHSTLENFYSYVEIEKRILQDIRTDGHTARVWVADLPVNGGTDTWHYRLLSVGSTGLVKVVRTNAAGISILTASARATSFTATQKVEF